MQPKELEALYTWFAAYTAGFTSEHPLTHRNLRMKMGHTARVAARCRALAASLGLDAEGALLAEALGIFHDAGRFPQFVRYGTFRDDISRNHAEMSVEALDAAGVWGPFTADERQLLTAAILNHNRFALPEDCEGETLRYSRIIRDADKLDNLQIDAEGKRQLYTITLHETGDRDAFTCADEQGVTPAVRAAILAGRCVRYAEIRTRCDLALIVIGGIYDLNFPYTFRELRETNCLPRIFSHLPQNETFAEMQRAVEAYVAAR